MVNCLCRRVSSCRKADLAEGMLGSIGFTDCCPGFTVAFSGLRISLILLVASGFRFGMLLAEPSVSKLRASREGTRSFRSFWHFVYPIKKPCNQNGGRASNEKAPRGFLRAFIVYFITSDYNNNLRVNSHSITFTLTSEIFFSASP